MTGWSTGSLREGKPDSQAGQLPLSRSNLQLRASRQGSAPSKSCFNGQLEGKRGAAISCFIAHDRKLCVKPHACSTSWSTPRMTHKGRFMSAPSRDETTFTHQPTPTHTRNLTAHVAPIKSVNLFFCRPSEPQTVSASLDRARRAWLQTHQNKTLSKHTLLLFFSSVILIALHCCDATRYKSSNLNYFTK